MTKQHNTNHRTHLRGVSEFLSKVRYAGVMSLLLLLLFSCNDDLDLRDAINYGSTEEGTINIRFTIPEAEYVVLTRGNDDGNERLLNNVALMVFDNEGNLLQRTNITPESMKDYGTSSISPRDFNYTLTLEGAAKGASNISIYAVANSNTGTESGDLLSEFITGSDKTLDELKKLKSPYYKDHFTEGERAGSFIMSGILEDNTINLQRSAAKITLKDYILDPTIFEFVEDSEDNGYSVYDVVNTSDSCFVIAPLLSTKHTTKAERTERSTRVKEVVDDKETYRYDSYANPTASTANSLIVIHGKYKGNPYYYAVPLLGENEEVLEIKPNHWYEMQLKGVSVAGYTNRDDAIANPFTSGIVVEIHDHAPAVLSMVSDGIRELGVESRIVMTSGTETTLTVKCYSKYENEIKDLQPLKPTFKSGDDWLEIVENSTIINYEGDGSETKGVTFEYTLKTKRNEIYVKRTAEIEFEWMGLEQTVNVIYDVFDADKVSNVSLYIYDERHNYEDREIVDVYWSFIKGIGISQNKHASTGGKAANQIPRLFGVQPIDLVNDKVRNEGFHFPMPYGNDPINKPWTYEYSIDFFPLIGKNSFIEPISEITGDSYIKNCVTFSWDERTQKGKLILTPRFSQEDYTYAIGNIKISFTFNKVEYIFTFDIYHTGFFHFPDIDYVPTTGDLGYYYYEVINVGEKDHWLDRNIGAKSNKMFIDNMDSQVGDSKAGGFYYTVATQGSFTHTMDPSLCPPGYHVPVTAEWNSLRLSTNFKSQTVTEDEKTFMTNYYACHNPEIGNIYFPKGRFHNSSELNGDSKCDTVNNSGDSGAGYYWTATEPPAMEKDEMGGWLRALYLNGSTTSYIDGSIKDYKMYVRAIADNNNHDNEENNYISFNVHNVTHVFLFDKTSQSALYNFPGKPVGSFQSSVKWQNFYETTTADLSNLLVLFVFQDSTDDSITIFTKDQNDLLPFAEQSQFNINLLSEDYAWTVDNHIGWYFDFCSGAKTAGNIIPSWAQPNTTCDSEKRAEYDGRPVKFGKGDKIRFKWVDKYEGQIHNRIYVAVNNDVKTPSEGEGWGVWRGPQVNNWDSNMRYYDFDNPENSANIYAVISNEGNVESRLRFNITATREGFAVVNDQESLYKYSGGGQYIRNVPTGWSITWEPQDLNDENNENYNWEIIFYDNDGQSGGNQGGDIDFTPENPAKEDILWKGETQFVNWSESTSFTNSELDNNFSWNNVEDDLILKIYFRKIADDFSLQVVTNNSWKEIAKDKNDFYHEYGEDDEILILQIKMTSQLKSLFSGDGGIRIYGNNSILLGLTLMPDDGKFSSFVYGDTEEGPTDTIWTSGYYGIAFTDSCVVEGIPWEKIQQGDILTLVVDVYWKSPEFELKLQKSNGSKVNGTLDVYEYTLTDEAKDYNYNIDISLEMLQDMKDGDGDLVITGKQGQLKSVIIKRPKND